MHYFVFKNYETNDEDISAETSYFNSNGSANSPTLRELKSVIHGP